MSSVISINEELIEEALSLGKMDSKEKLIERALRDYIDNQRRKKLLKLKGNIHFFDDYDYKSMRSEH